MLFIPPLNTIPTETPLTKKKTPKMDISFEILEHDGVIHIESVNEQFSPYTIDIDKFWGWVQKQGLNEYCNDYFDPTHPDNHRQETGTFTREEYLDLHYTIIKIDLVKYIDRYKRNPNK